MKIALNGLEKNVSASTLKDLVQEYCPHPKGVVVEINETIIKNSLWETTELHEGDRVELISFMGGG